MRSFLLADQSEQRRPHHRRRHEREGEPEVTPLHELLHAGPDAAAEQSCAGEHQEEAEDVQAEVSKGGEGPSI